MIDTLIHVALMAFISGMIGVLGWILGFACGMETERKQWKRLKTPAP